MLRYFRVRFFFFVISFGLLSSIKAQNIPQGKFNRVAFTAPSILGNPAGENARRHLTIYLPPGYDSAGNNYPVLYFLHGYTWNDSTTFASLHLNRLLDTAIDEGIIKPIIVVLPDSYTSFKGSFYTNSVLTGNWADYIGKDVIHYVDGHYKTLVRRDSRGIAGISMGGNGALKMGMLFADVFCSVYASSPATLNWSDGTNVSQPVFKTISCAKQLSEIKNNFSAMLMLDIARTYSPDLKRPPFFVDLPANYKNGVMQINDTAVKQWDSHFATQMIGQHLDELKSLRAIKLDWGRNDEFANVPITALAFSKKLECYGIKHYAEAFLGGHDDRLGGRDGRFFSEMLPFFNHFLDFTKL